MTKTITIESLKRMLETDPRLITSLIEGRDPVRCEMAENGGGDYTVTVTYLLEQKVIEVGP